MEKGLKPETLTLALNTHNRHLENEEGRAEYKE